MHSETRHTYIHAYVHTNVKNSSLLLQKQTIHTAQAFTWKFFNYLTEYHLYLSVSLYHNFVF